uniref:Uncharacterized protein n=1 Tax=Oryzias latipes TaxID=8090 RepID=A0A3B3IGX7_ORYLA
MMVSYLLPFFQTTMSNSDVNRSEKRDDGPERNLSVWNRTCSSPGRILGKLNVSVA